MAITRSGLDTNMPRNTPVANYEVVGYMTQSRSSQLQEGTDAVGIAIKGDNIELGGPITENNVPEQEVIQRQAQNVDSFILAKRKASRRTLSPDLTHTVKVYPEYTISEIQQMSNTQIREFVNETIDGARCPVCKRRGNFVPAGKLHMGQRPTWYWRCGGLEKKRGCSKFFPQSKMITLCMQAGKRYTRETYLPNELTERLSALEITLDESEKMEVISERDEPVHSPKTPKKEDHKSSMGKPQPVAPKPKLQQGGKQGQKSKPVTAQKSPSTGSNGKTFEQMCDGALRVLENPASTRDDMIAAGKVLRFIRPYMFGKTLIAPQKEQEKGIEVEVVKSTQPQKQSYATMARRNMPVQQRLPRYAPTLQKIDKIKDPQEKLEASFRAITRQKRASISKRVIKTGAIENEHLRDQVEGAKFLYVKGIRRQPARNIKKAFSQAGIDTTGIYDISFIGKSICSVLCKGEYVPIITEIINNSKSDARVLEDFNPLKPGVFRPELLQAEDHKSPEEFLIRRAAFSAVMTNNMIVATAFQSIIPPEFCAAYHEEIAIIEQERASRLHIRR